jgi:hypothetical protein
MQTILGANGIIGEELARELEKKLYYQDKISRTKSRKSAS